MREEEKNTSQKSRFQRILKKRWTMPAIYLASAAIILSAVFWYQNSDNQTAENGKDKETAETAKDFNQPSVEVNSKLEYNLVSPIRRLIKTEKPNVAFLDGHGELDFWSTCWTAMQFTKTSKTTRKS